MAAHPTWNRAVGQLACKFADQEKAIVYGARYEIARSAVIDCCEGADGLSAIIIVFICIVFIGVIAISVWMFPKRCARGKDNEVIVEPIY